MSWPTDALGAATSDLNQSIAKYAAKLARAGTGQHASLVSGLDASCNDFATDWHVKRFQHLGQHADPIGACRCVSVLFAGAVTMLSSMALR